MATVLFVVSQSKDGLPSFSPYRPILVGKQEKIPEGYLSDAVGESISERNPFYNEMTAIYWLYRHLEEFPELDHIGFCHYRRYFSFQNFKHSIFVRKAVKPDWISISEEQLTSFWKEFDLIVPCPAYVKSVRRHYEKSHNKEDLGLLREIIKEVAPSYLDVYDEYIEGNEECLYNMFVFSRADFLTYGEFVFPVLEEFFARRSHKEDRLYVSERLTGAFILYLRKRGKRALEASLLLTRSRSLPLACRQVKENFKTHPENGFLFKTKPLWLTLLPRFFEQRLRNRNRG